VYLLGVDQQQLACQTDVDYARKLDLIKAAGMDKVRIWGSCYFMDPRNALQPVAFRDGRFDLDTWDDAYWVRVRDFVAQAKARDIIVEYTLFANYADPDVWSGKYSASMFWNKGRNWNGAFTGNPDGSLIPEFFCTGVAGLPSYAERTSSGHDLRYYQLRIADKAISELGGLGNVYFEVFNEWPGKAGLWQQVVSWNQEFADHVHGAGQIVTVHIADYPAAEAWPYYWDRPSVDVLGLHSYRRTPREVFDIWRLAQAKGKVLQCNESWSYREVGVATVVREAWAHFLCGVYYGCYLDAPEQIGSDDGWQTLATATRAPRGVADAVRFWEMSPVDEHGQDQSALVTQGPGAKDWRVLCKPGAQYVIYCWGPPSTKEVRLRLPQGKYGYRWLDVRNGNGLGDGTVMGADVTAIPAPPATWDGDFGVALLVDRQ
jgi:hypothetical protein